MAAFVDLDSLVVHCEGAEASSMMLKRGLGVFVRIGDSAGDSAGREGVFDKAIVDRIRVVLELRVSGFVLVVWCWSPSSFLVGLKNVCERRGVTALEGRAALYLGTGRKSCQFVHVETVGALPWRPEIWDDFSQFYDRAVQGADSERRLFALARAVV